MNHRWRKWAYGVMAWVIFMAGFSVSASAGIVQTETNPANGHVYYMLTASSWTGAEAEAISLGGHLVTINNADENSWVISMFGGDDYALWIGLNDVAEEGTFVWTSGEPFVYGSSFDSPPWAEFEPGAESSGYDYVNIHMGNHPTSPGLWNDWPDSGINTSHGIVEVPEPATLSLLALGLGAVFMRKHRKG